MTGQPEFLSRVAGRRLKLAMKALVALAVLAVIFTVLSKADGQNANEKAKPGANGPKVTHKVRFAFNVFFEDIWGRGDVYIMIFFLWFDIFTTKISVNCILFVFY